MVRLINGWVAATALHLVLATPVLAQSVGGDGGAASAAGTASSAGAPGAPATQGQAPATGTTPDAGAVPGDSSASASAGQPTGAPAQPATSAATTDGASTAPGAVAATDATATAGTERARRIVDACMLPPIKLSAQEVEEFLTNPSSLLTTYGAQSLTLSNRVRSLAGSDGRTLPPILALVQGASADQKAGIGSGLGRTAFLCQSINPDYAAEIQSQIAQITEPGLLTAFLTATNDMQVAAIGGGGPGSAAAGAPGLSGGGTAGPGTAGTFDDATVGNLSNPFASRGGGAVLLGDSNDGDINANIFVNESVSPTQPN